jgi:hypothetical protein
MPDYSKGLIYTIRTRDGLYVGSTTNFTKRKYQHKNNIKSRNYKLYKTIRENDGEWDMKPFKEFPCETKQQLNIEEERIKCELNANLNTNCCDGWDDEKIKKRKENAVEYSKEWRKKNEEYIKEKQRKWYEKNRERVKAKVAKA